MPGDVVATYRASRRAYERGRLTTAVRHALLVTAAVALVAGIVFGTRALVWLPVTFLAVVVAEWRGVFLMAGARRGILAGLGTLLLPLSVLRPCCGIDAKAMGATCCVMPSACWASGAVIGLGISLLLPKAPEGRRMEAAVGMMLGVTSVAVTRCSMLFLGEAVGLLGGIVAGIAANSLARAWLGGHASRA
jgi:hypothetical protein